MTGHSNMAPKGPFRLVTVNTAPARAKILIGRLVEAVKDRYIIDYVANCESKTTPRNVDVDGSEDQCTRTYTSTMTGIDEVESKVREHRPDVLVSQAPQPSRMRREETVSNS
jgi:hypothetical protein